jgi:HEAT repeat protein
MHHLGAGSSTRRDSIGDAIARFGDLAVGPLAEALRNGTRSIRRHAATVLGHTARTEAAPALAAALADPDTDVRRAALVALGYLHGETADAAITAAKDSDDLRLRALAERVSAGRVPPPAAQTR